MLNQKFGRLLVVNEATRRVPNRPRYVCLCDCGKTIEADHYHLRSGHTSSCGCAKIDRLVGMNRTHGEANNCPEYKAWCEARQRCNNREHKRFPMYGGRGITVCERWNFYENFLADMGRRPSAKHSLDRIDVNGNYEPSNCRWATMLQQQQNKRVTQNYSYKGETLCITEWSRRLSIPQTTLNRWLVAEGMSIASSVTRFASRSS